MLISRIKNNVGFQNIKMADTGTKTDIGRNLLAFLDSLKATVEHDGLPIPSENCDGRNIYRFGSEQYKVDFEYKLISTPSNDAYINFVDINGIYYYDLLGSIRSCFNCTDISSCYNAIERARSAVTCKYNEARKLDLLCGISKILSHFEVFDKLYSVRQTLMFDYGASFDVLVAAIENALKTIESSCNAKEAGVSEAVSGIRELIAYLNGESDRKPL